MESMRQIWEVHPSPYGVPYYFNPKTKESRWSVPTGPLDLVVPPEEPAKPAPKKTAKQTEPAAKPAQEAAEFVSSSCSSGSEDEETPGDGASAADRAKQKVEDFKALLEEKGRDETMVC